MPDDTHLHWNPHKKLGMVTSISTPSSPTQREEAETNRTELMDQLVGNTRCREITAGTLLQWGGRREFTHENCPWASTSMPWHTRYVYMHVHIKHRLKTSEILIWSITQLMLKAWWVRGGNCRKRLFDLASRRPWICQAHRQNSGCGHQAGRGRSGDKGALQWWW